MEQKPWEQRGSHRGGSDRRFERSDRREDRGFGGRSDRREERGDRFGRSDRRDDRGFGGRSDRRDDRQEGRRFGGRDEGRRGGRPQAVRSGPRARAFEMRRFSERHDFAKSGVVKLDSDLAQYFKSADDVNKALRFLIEASLIVKPELAAKPAVVPAPEAPAEENDIVVDMFDDEEELDSEDEVVEDDDMFEDAVPYGDETSSSDKA